MAARISPRERGAAMQTQYTTIEGKARAASPLEMALNFKKVNSATFAGAQYVQMTIVYIKNATAWQPVGFRSPRELPL